jgi:general secretion pathway protein K
MALVLTLIGGFSEESSLTVRLTRNLTELAKARSIAEGGLNIGIAALLRSTPTTLRNYDGTPHPIGFAGAEIAFSVWDENGKVDINVAPDVVLSNLLAEFGVTGDANATLVDAIVDWRSPAGIHRMRAPSAADYRAAGLAPPRNAPFAATEDLRLVMGVTPELYRHLAPLITVHSHNPRINPMNAPPEVLRAIPGLTRPEVEGFLAARRAGTAQATTAGVMLRTGQQYLTFTPPQSVTVRAEAHLASGAVYAREAVIDFGRTGDAPFRVLQWRQHVAEPEEDPADAPKHTASAAR